MTPQQLKNSILQYAIQGKLVEQRAEEGNAEELYQQIQEEKQKLIKEGKLKKEKPLAPIEEDEIPFDIPESWKWVKLGDIGNWASGSTPSRNNPEYYGKGYSWLKTGDLNDGYVEYIPENITDLALKQCSLRLNPVGSILIAMYGATVGKLGILKIPATTNQACCACIPHIIYNLYLFYFLLSQKSNFINKGAGGAQPNISKEKIINSLFALPPLAEQKRIVAKIEELMALADKYQDSYVQLEALNKKFPADIQKSILQYAIQGKLVEQRTEEGTAEDLYAQIQEEKQKLIKEGKLKKEKPLAPITDKEIPFDIPESWKWCRLNELCNLISDGSHKTPNYTDSGIPFLSVKDISSGTLDFSDTKFISLKEHNLLVGRCKPEIDDVLFCRIGTLGKAIKINQNREFSIFVSLGLLKLTNSKIADYIVQIINSSYGYEWMQSVKAGAGTHAAKLNLVDIRNFIIPLPPLAEQKRIVAKIEELMAIVKKLE